MKELSFVLSGAGILGCVYSLVCMVIEMGDWAFQGQMPENTNVGIIVFFQVLFQIFLLLAIVGMTITIYQRQK